MFWRLTGLLLLIGFIVPPPSAPAADTPAKFIRSNRAKYKAQRIGDHVVIIAYGSFPTSGYKARLRQLPQEIFPPQFEFVEQKPSGITLQVITPFAEIASFKTGGPVESVTIYDANGAHKVKVTKPKQSFSAVR